MTGSKPTYPRTVGSVTKTSMAWHSAVPCWPQLEASVGLGVGQSQLPETSRQATVCLGEPAGILHKEVRTVINLINLPDNLQQQLRGWSCPEKQGLYKSAAAAGEELESTTEEVVSRLAAVPPGWPAGQEWRPG